MISQEMFLDTFRDTNKQQASSFLPSYCLSEIISVLFTTQAFKLIETIFLE